MRGERELERPCSGGNLAMVVHGGEKVVLKKQFASGGGHAAGAAPADAEPGARPSRAAPHFLQNRAPLLMGA